MTAPEAIASLRQLAAGIRETRPEADQEAAAARLLERVSCRGDAMVLRAGLVELGARALFGPPGAV